MSRRAAEIGASVLSLCVGAYFLWASLQLGVGQLSEPGPGMLPAVAAGLMVALSSLNLSMILGSTIVAGVIEVDRAAAFGVVGAIVAVIAMTIAMPRIGFLAASAAMLFCLFFFIASLPILRAAIMTVAVAAINYIVFAIVLKVPFP
jgi:putative tricarboxylic transport membrane protein